MNHNINKVLLFSLSIIVLLFVDDTSVKSYLYTLGLILISSHFLFKDLSTKAFYYFHFYLLVAVFLFIIFKYQSPLYQGLTGEGVADDTRFYPQIVGGKNIAFNITTSVYEIYPFSLLMRTLYVFDVYTPLNIVILNLLFITYLPIYVELLTQVIFNNTEISKRASLLTFLFPITTFFGCIILREGLIAVSIVAGLFYFKMKNYYALLICIFLVGYIRMGSLIFLLLGLFCLYRAELISNNKKYLFNCVIIITFCFLIFLFPYLSELSDGKFSGSLYREMNDFWDGSTIEKLTQLPFPINIVSTTLFFLYIPFFKLPKMVDGMYLVRDFFEFILTPLLMLLFLWKNIYNAILTALKSSNIHLHNLILYIILSAFLLGTVSLQSRHKTMLYPFICILAAYGMVNYNKKYHKLTMILYAVTFLANIVFFSNSI